MEPVTLALIGGGILVWIATQQKKHAQSKPANIQWDGTAWQIPLRWWRSAEPKVASKLSAMPELDTTVIAWELLEGQVPDVAGGRPTTPYAPNGQPWQGDVPGSEDYWPGAPTVLYLMDHIAETVNAAIPNWQATGEVVLVEED